jgi:Glycoside hydrolase 123, catalytic domain
MNINRLVSVATVIISGVFSMSARARAAGTKAPAVLETNSPWRCFVVRGSDLAVTESGKVCHLYEFGAKKGVKIDGKRANKLNEVTAPRFTALPPTDWRRPDFNDGDWASTRGPQYAFVPGRYGMHGRYLPVTLVCLRGRFSVKDPARAAGLKLSLEFEGGAVVYVNGKELKREHLPAGKLKPDTPATTYPKDAFVAPNGNLLRHKYGDPKKYPDRYKMRIRKISNLKIPASALRKGVNVLAVEIHQAAGHEAMFTGKSKKVHPQPGCWWNRVGLVNLRMDAGSATGVTPAGAKCEKLRVWNHAVFVRVTEEDTGEPLELLRPVRIEATRNGWFSGKVLIGSPVPIKGLKTEVGDFAGPGKIAAACVAIRYPRPDGMRRRSKKLWFDSLQNVPPEPIAVLSGSGTALQPIWITVNVPASAKSGDYKSALKISAAGGFTTTVPLELHVADWWLPPSREFRTHVGLVQSPESLAMQYGVPMWSKKHWELLDRSFALMARAGTKTVYLTAVRKTHFGNEHSMIRFKRGKEGKLHPDLSIAGKYLALAVKHLGKVPVVGIYCWEPPGSSGHFGKYAPKDREILLTLTDGAGKLEKIKGPEWGTPKCQEFWNTTFKAIRAMLAKHGVNKSMMFAMAGDYIPTLGAVDQLHKAAPEATWAVHCHPYRPKIHNVATGYLCSVWGVFGTRDPALPKDYYGNNRYIGWKNPFLITAFPRTGNPIYEIFCVSPITLYRFMGEGALVSAGRPNAKPPGVRGFGRIGADFWKVLKDKRGRGTFVCGRYPESAWGQLNLAYSTPYVLAPGKNGSVSTTRFEMLCEGLQEAEARVFIEQALLDPARKSKLGKELSARCQEMLDERVRTFMRAAGARERLSADWTWYFSSNPLKATRKLYATAGQVATRLGTRK